MEEQERYRKAKERVKEIKGFYIHATMYLLVNAGLVVINLTTSNEYYWFVWPILGWAIGLVAHAIAVFGIPGLFDREWEERKIREYMGTDHDNDRSDPGS